MKLRLLCLASLLTLGFLAAGCGNVDLTPPSLGDRVVEGTVVFSHPGALPENVEVIVQVVDPARGGRGEVLGEQIIKAPGEPPIAFKIEYRAEDPMLRRGLNIDVRISFGKTLAYYTASTHPLTSANERDSHEVVVVPAAGAR